MLGRICVYMKGTRPSQVGEETRLLLLLGSCIRTVVTMRFFKNYRVYVLTSVAYLGSLLFGMFSLVSSHLAMSKGLILCLNQPRGFTESADL